MNYKRVISTSVSDLHLNSVSDSIKRLAISHDGHPEKAMNLSDPSSLPQQHIGILTVMSSARDDFSSKYEVLREIGKGGFSTVYQCRNKNTGLEYAVKFVDLRPLRLRERFNPLRLRREVDIMKRLHHPSIIEFVDVFEDNDTLMMIMEYCPGKELFDVILERKYFEESDARPIFAQIARALFYLHSLNILHRDVKPENILISSIPDHTGQVVAKLLDFGLSKNAGNGSAAKTFVGTPCYVAPEVEYTSKGLGGTYSFPADCWSLGAVLYVMLVARFPEFEQDPTGKIVVKLSPGLWGNVSSDAKDLIRSLMNTNPAARLSMASALMHPWLGRYRATQEELSRVSVVNYDLNRKLQEEETRLEAEERKARAAANRHNNRPAHAQHGQQQQKLNNVGELDIDEDTEDVEINASGVVVHHQAMVVRGAGTEAVATIAKADPAGIQLAPLLHLQRSIATCFDEVHASYQDMPEVASEIREGASLCRDQLTQSLKMLRKVEQTAAAVLNMFPDLELAVEEGEPQLAANFFATVKEWVTDLRELVNSTQTINKASMHQIQLIVERSTIGLLAREKQKQQIASNSINVPRKLLDTAMQKLGLAEKACCLIGNGESDEVDPATDTVELDANHILELFMTLFGSGGSGSVGAVGGVKSPRPTAASSSAPKNPPPEVFFGQPTRVYSIDSDSQSPHSTQANSSTSSLTKQTSHTSSSVLRGSAATSSILLHHNSHTSNCSNTSTASVQRDRADTEEMSDGDRQSMDSSNLSPSPSVSPSPSPSPATPGQTPTRIYPVTDVNYVYAMDLDEDVERNDSYGSTISLETFAPLPQGMPIPVPPVKGSSSSSAKSVSNSSKVPLLMNGSKPGAAQPNKQHADAAAHLADALNKLRQVDLILEELSVFWANTEVVLDLLTKKGQHVEQFIGFATKPKLMARFLERMEEYKRFWENVSMMCSNYIAGVQTTNEEQRMYGFLDTDVASVHSASSLSSAHTTPKNHQRPLYTRPGGGMPSVDSTKMPSYMTPSK